jgi:hypothetical protein
LLGIARRKLKEAEQGDKIPEMTKRVQDSKSYDEALQVIMEYVEVE